MVHISTGVTSRPPATARAIHRRLLVGVDADVGAVTSLGDDVFVVFLNNDQHIEVYNVASAYIQHTRKIPVPGLGYCCWGLAACERYNCVYASDWGNDIIHRVELSGYYAVMKWSVASRPAGLSLTSHHNLLVACQGEYKIQEFTTYGFLLRNIKLQESGKIEKPQQVIYYTSSPNYMLIKAYFCSLLSAPHIRFRVEIFLVDGMHLTFGMMTLHCIS